MLCRCLIYSSIVNNTASSLAAAAEVYLHLPSDVLFEIYTVRHLSTWVWKPTRDLPMRGVTTQVSALKSSKAWTTALKKKPDTCGAAPSLLRMRGILLQNFLERAKLFITAGQSFSSAEITRPSYLKEVRIYRGSP